MAGRLPDRERFPFCRLIGRVLQHAEFGRMYPSKQTEFAVDIEHRNPASTGQFAWSCTRRRVPPYVYCLSSFPDVAVSELGDISCTEIASCRASLSNDYLRCLDLIEAWTLQRMHRSSANS